MKIHFIFSFFPLAFYSCSSNFTRKAEEASNRNNPDEAIYYSTQALIQNPEDVNALYIRALSKYDKGNLEGMYNDLKRLDGLNPRYRGLNYHLGVVYEAKRDTTAAKERYKTEILFNPNLWQAYNNLSSLFLAEKDYDKALKYLDTALIWSPNESNLFLNRGWVYYESGKLSRALEDYNRALQQGDTFSVYIYSNRAIVRSALGDTAGAFSDLDTAIAIHPEIGLFKYLKGKLYLEKGDTTRACVNFRSGSKACIPEAKMLYEKYCKG